MTSAAGGGHHVMQSDVGRLALPGEFKTAVMRAIKLEVFNDPVYIPKNLDEADRLQFKANEFWNGKTGTEMWDLKRTTTNSFLDIASKQSMACGCAVIGSSTAPVREVIRHGENGLLVDFFDPGAIAQQVAAALQNGGAVAALRQRARHTAHGGYAIATGVRGYRALLGLAAARDTTVGAHSLSGTVH
ncbi:glycosyltransferase [Massilia sp. TSP1-1-2]|uniref:glycosyltransferase n=1 Tax=unclassified Massilia TaxID=2609279 RepID=UPI003CE9ACE5